MPTINTENARNIREALSVFVHIQQVQNIALTITASNTAIQDTTTLQASEIDLTPLTDLAGAGFPLNGTCTLYDSTQQATVETGKVGIRSNIGTAMAVTVTSETVINALTLRLFGAGTLTCNGISYDIREFIVLPVNSTTVTFTVTPDTGARVSIEDIQAGITLDFNNDNLTACTLDLESDLSLIDASWRVSSIEVQGYYPDDISQAVSNMGDGVPIIYYAGYPGDYSPPRYFYVSEAVTQKDGLITIKGEDASSRLENYTQPEALWQTNRQNAQQAFYRKLESYIRGAGINLASKETEPGLVGTDKTAYTVMLKEATYREYVQYMQDITNKNGFYPRFIDAGIPTLRWSTPTPIWDIYKEDIGEWEKTTERNLNKIYGDDKEKPLHCVLNVANKKTTIDTKNVKKGKEYSINYDDNYYYNVTYKNGSWVSSTLHSLKLKALKTTVSKKVKVQSGWTKKSKKYKKGSNISLSSKATNVKKTKSGNYIVVTWKEPKYVTKTVKQPQMIVTGYRVTTGANSSNLVSTARLGVTKEVKNLLWGCFATNYGNSAYLLPNYSDVFSKSNIKGTFTYKGHPNMQPRDVFRLYEFDRETYTVCTIESIETKHESGGMISTITYREGVY